MDRAHARSEGRAARRRGIASRRRGKKNGVLTVGVRPRGLALSTEAGPATISGRIDLVEPMGAETLIHLRIGADDLRVVTGRRVSAAVGEAIHVAPAAGQVHSFDHEGARIAS